MYDLKKLKENRDEILKAELAAFLHDVGKLHAGHQAKYLRDKQTGDYFHAHLGKRQNVVCPDITPKLPAELMKQSISYPKQTKTDEQFEAALAQIIACHHRPRDNSLKQKWNNLDPFIRLSAYADWRDSEYDRENISSLSMCRPISEKFGVFSAFGWERFVYTENKAIRTEILQDFFFSDENFQNFFHLKEAFRCAIWSIKQSGLSSIDRHNFFSCLRLLFVRAAGDTRYSVNDISLWDHSWSISQLYKTIISYAFLQDRGLSTVVNDFQSRKLKPQLLPLRIDGLGYLSASNNIPDLMGRRKLLREIYDALQDILEWEFPLAGEVYRDENGPVFLTFLQDKDREKVINLSDPILPESDSNNHLVKQAYLKALQNGKKSLEEYIRQVVIELSHGDLTLPPEISLVTYTQKRTNTQDGKSLGDILADEQKDGLWLQADVSKIQEAWDELLENTEDSEGVCQICGLRPQGYGRWLSIENKDDANEARGEWEKHYAHKHRPNKSYHGKDKKEKNCQVCKAISRKMCGVCLERRADRAKSWAQGIEKSPEERFQNNHPETVWLDEVADKNGRIALIVGYFPLEHWLDGTLVRSLAMFKRDAAKNEPVNHQISVLDDQGKSVKVVLGPKPVSYSRIRRIWETTRRFWQDVAPTDAPPKELLDFCQQNNLALEDLWEGPLSLEKSLAGEKIGEKRSRLFLKAKNATELAKDLGPFHAYELRVKNRKVAVLWVPPDATDKKNTPLKYRGGFWIIENLDYLKNQFEQDFREVIQENKFYEVYEPTEYGSPGSFKTKLQIEEILPDLNDKEEQEKISYTPLISILAEPRTFMAIVPADRVFEIVKAIKAKYEREMGRVRNRLPLHIGVVFANRKMPLRAIMDAGRRMLEQKWKNMVWEIVPNDDGFLSEGKGIATEKDLDENVLENEYKEIFKEVSSGNNEKILTHQFKKWHRIVLRQEVQLKNQRTKNDKKEIYRYVVWYVPVLMGDGSTHDNWYPYVFWQHDKDGKTDPGSATQPRIFYYQTPNPFNLDQNGNPQQGWLVHAGELQPGDKIYFTPATFDFEILDFNARRFEIAYDEGGKRKNSLAKPYLLDEIRILEQIWAFITGKDKPNVKPRLSTTQMFALREMIETKREEWFDNLSNSLTDENFRKFCRALLANAEWQWGKPDGKKLEWLTEMAVQGYFTDTIYLFHHIMKQGVEETKQ